MSASKGSVYYKIKLYIKTKKQETKVDNAQQQTVSSSTSYKQGEVTQTPTETKKEKTKIERCTNNNNHFLNVGNSGKWFISKNDAIAYYNQQTKYWSDYLDNCGEGNEDAAWEEYKKKCPSGYEVYSCMYCNKWTINFYYR